MIWGWVRWFRRTQPRTLPSILSLIGFTLSHGIRPACGFVSAVCARDRRLSVLRPAAAQNLPVGRVAVTFGDRVALSRSLRTRRALRLNEWYRRFECLSLRHAVLSAVKSAGLLRKLQEMGAIPQLLPSNRTGEDVLPNAPRRFGAFFSRRDPSSPVLLASFAAFFSGGHTSSPVSRGQWSDVFCRCKYTAREDTLPRCETSA